MERRTFLTGVAVPLITGAAGTLSAQTPAAPRGRLKQSVMGSVWTGSTTPFEERCKILSRIGFKGVDLPSAQQVPILRQNGLTPTMMVGTGTSFQNGLIRKELHDKIEEATRAGIDTCASVGCSILIALPGERRGMSREEGADNAVAILNRVKGYAEQKNVTICMENTNSKIAADQRTDQVFDRAAWGFDVCKRVNSPRVKVMFDIYHAQIMDGDITRTLRDNMDRICHIHAAGARSPRNRRHTGTQLQVHRQGHRRYRIHRIYSPWWRLSPGSDSVKGLERCFEILNV